MQAFRRNKCGRQKPGDRAEDNPLRDENANAFREDLVCCRWASVTPLGSMLRLDCNTMGEPADLQATGVNRKKRVQRRRPKTQPAAISNTD